MVVAFVMVPHPVWPRGCAEEWLYALAPMMENVGGGYEKSNQSLLRACELKIVCVFFTLGKATHNPRRTTQRKLPPLKPGGMKNYQVDDYFCRQTYELLTTQVLKLGNRAILLLIPAICNGTCRAKSVCCCK